MKAYSQYLTINDVFWLFEASSGTDIARADFISPTKLKKLTRLGLLTSRDGKLFITVQGIAALKEITYGDGHTYTPYPYEPTEPAPAPDHAEQLPLDGMIDAPESEAGK